MTAERITELIKVLFTAKGLGDVISPITPVAGGFLHRMYRVDTAKRSFAVKHLNPEIMKRPEARENYKRAESLEKKIEDAGISIVPAISIDGKKMQEYQGEFFYIFNWQNGKVTDWNHISADQCRQAGAIQGRIHAIESKKVENADPELLCIDWNDFVSKAKMQNEEITKMLLENKELLTYAQNVLNDARRKLPGILTITDEDMDPKNVMWEEGKPVVIDLECLSYGNPISSALQLSLQWAGITTGNLEYDKIGSFFEGYLETYDNGFRDYPSVFGLAYTWLEWLEYNLNRALGQCQDEREQKMGMDEVRNTIARIRYLYDREERIKRRFDTIKGIENQH